MHRKNSVHRGVPAREGAWSGGVCFRGAPGPRGSAHRGVPGPGGCLLPGGSGPGRGAWWRPPGTTTAAGGTHPTGMHSCFHKVFRNFW